MIAWMLLWVDKPADGTPVLFRVKGEKAPRVGVYSEPSEELPHAGFTDIHEAAFYRANRVSHWARYNMP